LPLHYPVDYRRDMRADARRNHDAVLEAGATLLAERPAASMQEIADASGVGRTTFYRHFPAREDLVAALVARVAEEVTAVSLAAFSGGGDASDVLHRFSKDIVALGDRWNFLREQRDDLRASLGESDRAYRDWVAEHQRDGQLRDDLPADWILAVTRGLIGEAIHEARTLGPERAGDLLAQTMVSLLEPRR
jgi:AcrR family transcriptional regulator